MDGSMDENMTFSDGNGGNFSSMGSQHLLGGHNGASNGAFSGSTSRSSPFDAGVSGSQRMSQSGTATPNRNAGQSSTFSPTEAAFLYYSSNSGGFSSNNLNNSRSQGQLSSAYLSNSSIHSGQDAYGPTTNGQYDTNFSAGWNGSISRSTSQSGNGERMDQQQQGNRIVGGYSQSPSSHHPEWQGMRRIGSQDSQGQGGDTAYGQHNYGNSGNSSEYNTSSPNMMIIGQQQSMGSMGSRSSSINRFSSSQMSQMGGGSQGISKNNSSCGGNNTGGSNAQGRALNKMLLEILRDRMVDPNRLAMAIDANIERMDCVNLATLLFHTGKKRLLLTPSFIKRIATRFNLLKEELRAREASNALYGLKCMSSDCVGK